MFPLRLCGGKLLVAVTRERRYGPSRLRVNVDDDTPQNPARRPGGVPLAFQTNVQLELHLHRSGNSTFCARYRTNLFLTGVLSFAVFRHSAEPEYDSELQSRRSHGGPRAGHEVKVHPRSATLDRTRSVAGSLRTLDVALSDQRAERVEAVAWQRASASVEPRRLSVQ